MKVAYIALDPLKYARIRKIAYSINKSRCIDFTVMIPKVRKIWRGGKIGRLIVGFLNYIAVMLQILFVNADVYWVANCPDILALPLVFRKRRYILEYRSPWSLQVKQELGSGPWARLSMILEGAALKHASIITLTTSKLLPRIKRYNKPVFVIPNYPLRTFTTSLSREEFRKKQGVNVESKIVLFVGRLSRIEGADMLCEIISKTLKKVDALFWIIGDGPLYPLLDHCTKRFQSNAKLYGWQPYENIPNFINASDVCIVPRHKVPYSHYYNEEGVTKISEYMFYKKPIVACGIADSQQYLLVAEEKMAEGIKQALEGSAHASNRRTWEDYCDAKIVDLFTFIQRNIL